MSTVNKIIKKNIDEASCRDEIKEFLTEIIELELKKVILQQKRYMYADDLRALIGKYTTATSEL